MNKKDAALWNGTCLVGCVADFTCIVPATPLPAAVGANAPTRSAQSAPQSDGGNASSFAGLLFGGLEIFESGESSTSDDAGDSLSGRSLDWAPALAPATLAGTLLEGVEADFGPFGQEPEQLYNDGLTADTVTAWIPIPGMVAEQTAQMVLGSVRLTLSGTERAEPDVTDNADVRLGAHPGAEAAGMADWGWQDSAATSYGLALAGCRADQVTPGTGSTGTLDENASRSGRYTAVRQTETGLPSGTHGPMPWSRPPGLEEGSLASPSNPAEHVTRGAFSRACAEMGNPTGSTDPAVVAGKLQQTGTSAALKATDITEGGRLPGFPIFARGRKENLAQQPQTRLASPSATVLEASHSLVPGAGEDETSQSSNYPPGPFDAKMRPAPVTSGQPRAGTSAEPAKATEDGQADPTSRKQAEEHAEGNSNGPDSRRSAAATAGDSAGEAVPRESTQSTQEFSVIPTPRNGAHSADPLKGGVKQPESKSTAAWLAEPPQPADNPRPQAALREITLRVDSGGGQHVDLQFLESGGAVNLKLRTQDPRMADSLRNGIPQLEADLGTRGWKAELNPVTGPLRSTTTVEPAERGEQPGALSTRGTGTFDGAGREQMGSGADPGSQRRQQDWSSDEQELRELAALRRLAVKGGVR